MGLPVGREALLRFIVLQMKTMSSHHRAAGTRQWNSNVSSSTRWSCTLSAIESPQSGHEVSTRPSVCRAAHMPIASHAQFAYHHRPRACTRYAVGTAADGFELDERALRPVPNGKRPRVHLGRSLRARHPSRPRAVRRRPRVAHTLPPVDPHASAGGAAARMRVSREALGPSAQTAGRGARRQSRLRR